MESLPDDMTLMQPWGDVSAEDLAFELPPNSEAVFPPYGFTRLVDVTGTEADIVSAARVSFHKASDSEQAAAYQKAVWDLELADLPVPEELRKGAEGFELSERERGLLRWLALNHHGTPFEKGFKAEFLVRAPLFVFREWHRHRIGISINEESGRYVGLRPHFYVPRREDLRSQEGKPGNYHFVPITDRQLQDEILLDWIEGNQMDWDRYQRQLSRGLAREMSRDCLPLNLYSEMRWSVNARSLLNFIALRNAEDALLEIRRYAAQLEDTLADYLPITHQAFIESGRISP